MPCKGGQKCAPKSTTPTSAVAKNAHRSIIRGCDIAVHSSFDIVAFACSNSAPKFRPKPSSRCTNAVQRWLETRAKIDYFDRIVGFSPRPGHCAPGRDRRPLPVAQRGLVIIPRTKDQNQGFSPPPLLLSFPLPGVPMPSRAPPSKRTKIHQYHTIHTIHNDPRDLAKFPTLPTFPRTFQLSTCSRTLPALPLLKPRFRTPRGASFPGVT